MALETKKLRSQTLKNKNILKYIDIENDPKQTNEVPPMLTTASDTSNVSMQRNGFVTTKTITPTILYDERRKRTKNVTLVLYHLR